jgi:hypothetical protein
LIAPCIKYNLRISSKNKSIKYVYFGTNHTANDSGKSAPLERLACHIRKVNKTHSCLLDVKRKSKKDDDNHIIVNCDSKINFIYEYCKNHKEYEIYLIRNYKEYLTTPEASEDLHLLNKEKYNNKKGLKPPKKIMDSLKNGFNN